jgi:hypothetical protein
MRAVAAALLAVACSHPAIAGTTLQASVLDKLTGDWIAQGPLLGKPVCDAARARWVLDGQFLELSFNSKMPGRPYQAMIFIGQDGPALSVHWLDVFGGTFAKVLGAGELDKDGASLTFPYPDGAFRDRLSYDRPHDRWRLLIQTGSGAKTQVLSDWMFTRAASSACAGGSGAG